MQAGNSRRDDTPATDRIEALLNGANASNLCEDDSELKSLLSPDQRQSPNLENVFRSVAIRHLLDGLVPVRIGLAGG
jgi:hypothetical protein